MGNAIDAIAVGNTVDVLKIAIRRGRVVITARDPAVAKATVLIVTRDNADVLDVLRSAVADASSLEDGRRVLVRLKRDPRALVARVGRAQGALAIVAVPE